MAQAFSPNRMQQVLAETGEASERERDLPAQAMVYYTIAMALYVGSSTRDRLEAAWAPPRTKMLVSLTTPTVLKLSKISDC